MQKKIVFLVLFALIAAGGYGQKQLPPTYYLDSVRVNVSNCFVNSKSIASVNVAKNTPNGSVYISLKPNTKFITLNDILKANSKIDRSKTPLLIVVDNRYVAEPDSVMIDSSYYVCVTLRSLTDCSYLEAKYRDLMVLEVTLLDKKPGIMLRGSEAFNPLEVTE